MSVFALTACSEPHIKLHVEGPGPSDAIDAHSADPSDHPIGSSQESVVCSGPDDQVAALGAICTPEGAPWGFSTAVGDMSVMIGGTGDGPKLLVLGYFGGPEMLVDHSEDIRYSVFLLREWPAMRDEGVDWYELAALAQWSRAEPVVGEIATFRAYPVACTLDALDASATLEVGEVTLELHFTVGNGC